MSLLKIKPFIIDDTTASDAFVQANAAFSQANSSGSFANGAFAHANASFAFANTISGGAAIDNVARSLANSSASFANGSFDRANSGYDQANTGASFANGSFVVANSAASFANGAFVTANAAAVFANGAFDRANSGYGVANTGASFANGAFVVANSAASFANGAFVTANAAFIQANSNYTSAVTKLMVTTPGMYYSIDQYSGNNPTIYIRAGETIAFNLNVSGHPFMVRLSSGGSNYDTGLTHIATDGTLSTGSSAQGKITGILYWKVPYDIVGSTYVYQCSVHSGMVGNIVIDQPTVIAFNQANAAFTQANAAFTAANNSTDAWVRTQANNAYNTANSAGSFANGSFVVANSAASFANGSFVTANSGATFANAAFARANAAYAQANTGGGASSVDTYISLTMTGVITVPYTGTSRFYPPRAMTLSTVYANLSTAASGGNFTYIIKKNGTSIGNTFTIIQNETVMTPANISVSLATTDYLTLDVNGASATDLFVRIKYTNT